MAALITLLRGINVGGNRLVPMADLRALYASLGFANVRTYVQSGNVVCTAPDGEPVPSVAARLAAAIAQRFGFTVPVIVRTTAELRAAVAQNPFAGRPAIEPGKLLVWFPAEPLAAETRAKVLSMAVPPEELVAGERELYFYFPNGIGQSKSPLAAMERALAVPITGRNWNTVTKLLAMAEEIA